MIYLSGRAPKEKFIFLIDRDTGEKLASTISDQSGEFEFEVDTDDLSKEYDVICSLSSLVNLLNLEPVEGNGILLPPFPEQISPAFTIETLFYWTSSTLPISSNGIWTHMTESTAMRLEIRPGVGICVKLSNFDPGGLGVFPEEHVINHIAFTYSIDTGLIVYLNGKIIQEVSGNPGTLFGSYGNVIFNGHYPNYDRPFNGSLLDFRFWTVVRTKEEILENMYTRLSGYESGLYAYYKLDEGTGATVYDSTSNHLDGTVQGSFSWDQSMDVFDTLEDNSLIKRVKGA